MKVLKIIGIVVLVAVVAIVLFFFYFKSTLTPQYSGELSIEGISEEVEVYYTEHGVPHIYASNSKDAYYAFGYVHAQDRLWQMDLLRHVGSGRLAELFGSELVSTDKFLRTVGLAKYSKESAEAYRVRNHESQILVAAYLAGINDFISNNPKTLEHTALGVEVEPFTEENVFEVLTYMAFSFQNAHLTDPFLTELAAKLDSSYLEDLQIYHYPKETVIPNFDNSYAALSSSTSTSLEKVNVPTFIGSNSWVLSGDRTESGSVMLANDPHIGFSQPSVWYEAHIITPETEYYGYHLAGNPFPPILHTPDYANGITMFENDDADFYVEEIHPEDSNRYRHKGEWKNITSRSETVRVKDADDVNFTIRSTAHGPIVSDILQDEPLEDIVSMYWVTTNFENKLLESTYDFTRAKSIQDVEKGASGIHGPGLNIMYGDKKGNVAWWAVGKLIQRRNEQSSKTFYQGSTGADDVISFYPFNENPHAINPSTGYTYSANNQPDTAVNGVVYSGYYLPDDRGERIVELIVSEEKFTVDEVKEMMLDHTSVMFGEIKGILLHAIRDTEESELLSYLIQWDGSFEKDDFRPLIFQKWLYEIVEGSMRDEMGNKLWDTFLQTHTSKVVIEHLVKNKKSEWWDNINTTSVESREEIIASSFDKSVKDLKAYWGKGFKDWKWGNAHLLTHNHAMGTALNFLNIGPFKVSGSNQVINNLGFTYTGEKYQEITFGPSTRRIVDFSDVRNNSWSILPTGQSGNYFSPYYADQAEMYARGEFRKMMMEEREIQKSINLLLLQPKN